MLKLSIVKISMLPNFICVFNAVPPRIPEIYLFLSTNWFWSLYEVAKDSEQPTQYRRPEVSVELILPYVETYFQATVIKPVWCWPKNRQVDLEKNREPRNAAT